MEVSDRKYALKEKYNIPANKTKFSCISDKYYDEFISDEDLKIIIEANIEELYELVNGVDIKGLITTDAINIMPSKYINHIDRIKMLFSINMNFYRLANYRGLSVSGKNIMLRVATLLSEIDVLEVYQELYNSDPIKDVNNRRNYKQKKSGKR